MWVQTWWMQDWIEAEAPDDGAAAGAASDGDAGDASAATGDDAGSGGERPSFEDAIGAALSGEHDEGEASDDGTGDEPDAGDLDTHAKGEPGKQGAGQADEKGAALTERDLTPPEGLSDSGRARFEKLTSGYREVSAERDQFRQQFEEVAERHNALVSLVQDTGANNDEFATALEYMRMVHSDDPDDLQRALKLVEAERAQIATRLGVKAEGVDQLAEFPDLREAVDNLDMTEDYALELAAARRNQNRHQQRQHAQRETQQRTEQHQQAVQQGIADLNAWDAQKASTSTDYAQIRKVLEPEIEHIARNFPPSQWVAETQRAWDRIARSFEVAAGVTGRQRRGPISGGSRAGGGGRAAPRSADEAIAQAIDGPL